MFDLIMCICSFIINNWQTLIPLIFAIIGGGFALYQWRESVRIRRADFINQINDRIRFDKDFATTLYTIEYGNSWYDENFHSEKEKEFAFDKVLSYCDYVCYLKSNKNITTKEFRVFRYRINRVCISCSTKRYLWNLYHFSKKSNADCSFQFLIDYAIANNLFPKDFKKNTTLYTKTLNW